MADVRSMLRAERASRRITHPHASYTNDGKLLCNLCETLVKSEVQWQSHLHSTQHNLRSQRKEDGAAARTVGTTEGSSMKRKRKADEIESSPIDERKKAKAVNFDLPPQENRTKINLQKTHVDEEIESPVSAIAPSTTTRVPLSRQDDIDKDLAAFEREIDELQRANGEVPLQPTLSALNAEATIVARPITAAELASQVREEQSEQRSKRDIELEAEREDAARILEEEFDEMENFEERVRRLRERREELRKVSTDANTQQVQGTGPADEAIDQDDDDSDYEDTDWQFGAG